SITLDNATTSADSLGLDVDNNSTITALSVGHITPVSIASGKSLSGAITVTAGSLKLTEAGTLASTIAMSGGTIDADESLAVSGALSHTADITIDVADNKTLTYSGAAISLGAKTLTLSGGGTLSNTNAFVLNNANSKLLLNSITLDNATTSANSLGLDVDNNSTITSLSVGHITPVSIASSKSLSGAITVTAGSIKLDEAGTLGSTVSMSGGTLDADNNLTLSGALTQSGNITIDVAENKTLGYSGAAVSLGANTLTMSGKGTFSNTNALVLNNASSKLLLDNTTTVGKVSTSLASLGVDVNESSTITSLAVAHTTPVSIAAGKTLSGGITVTAGSLKLGEAGTLASNISMSGGTLEADNNLTLSGGLTQSGNITIAVAENKTLGYSGASVNLGAKTLTMSGKGTFNNTNALVLNDADSKLLLSNTTTVGSVSTSADISGYSSGQLRLGIDVDEDSTITSLAVGHTTPVSIADGKTLSGAVTVTAGSIKLVETGTLASTVSMSGGKLAAEKNLTLSGPLTQSGNIVIQVKQDKTLSYSGAAVNLGANTLTMWGKGTFGNTNALVLNNASSKLVLSNETTVNSVSTSSNSLGVDVDQSSTITSLSVGHTTPVSIKAGKTLSGGITVTGGSIKLGKTGTLVSAVTMSGGTLDADNSLTLSGALSHTADITIDVAENKTLTYSGTAINVGANTITLSGGGSFVSGGITLNNAQSKLLLNKITLDNASTFANSLGLDVDDNSAITLLSVGHITPVSIKANKSLSGSITVTAGSLKLTEAGTLASSVSMSGGVLDADESSTVSGALSHSADITIDVADTKTLTYSGSAISLGANTLTLSGGGSLVSGGLTLNNANSKLLLNSIT
nr:hypothetical protein [Candidatus Neomarinimicrobiota bacterium]